MDFILLENFFATYTLPTIIIAITVGISSFILGKFTDKINATVRNYLAFFLSIILYFAYDMIFISKALCFKPDAFYAGVLSGSLSRIFYSAIKKFFEGKPSCCSAVKLLIEGLIDGVVHENNLSATAISIEKLFAIETEQLSLKEQIANILAVNAVKPFSLDEFESVALLIIQAVNILKNGESN